MKGLPSANKSRLPFGTPLSHTHIVVVIVCILLSFGLGSACVSKVNHVCNGAILRRTDIYQNVETIIGAVVESMKQIYIIKNSAIPTRKSVNKVMKQKCNN